MSGIHCGQVEVVQPNHSPNMRPTVEEQDVKEEDKSPLSQPDHAQRPTNLPLTTASPPPILSERESWRMAFKDRQVAADTSTNLKRKLADFMTSLPPTNQTEDTTKPSKPNMIKPKFDVKYAEHLIHLGNARYDVYGEVLDTAVLRIQECDYKVFNGEKQQSKMIRFTKQQWFDLVSSVDTVNDAINDFDEIKLHIGGNTYITVQPQRSRVDIRDYFLPDDAKCRMDVAPKAFEASLIPTRRGISLMYEEWGHLVQKGIPLITAGADQLKLPHGVPCFSTHDAQRDWLACNHCNPNGCMEWR
jgi:hypothetical protein